MKRLPLALLACSGLLAQFTPPSGGTGTANTYTKTQTFAVGGGPTIPSIVIVSSDGGGGTISLGTVTNAGINVFKLGVDGPGVLNQIHFTTSKNTTTGSGATFVINPGQANGLDQNGASLLFATGDSTGAGISGFFRWSMTVPTTSGTNLVTQTDFLDLTTTYFSPATSNLLTLGQPSTPWASVWAFNSLNLQKSSITDLGTGVQRFACTTATCQYQFFDGTNTYNQQLYNANTLEVNLNSGGTGNGTFLGALKSAKLLGGTTNPSIVANAAAGVATGGTCSVNSNASDVAGVISCTTGTATTGSGATVFTVTFASSTAYTNAQCVLFPENANAQALSSATAPFIANLSNTTTFHATVGATALATSTTYAWTYVCIG